MNLIRAVITRNLGVLLTLFQPEVADYAHHITASTPGFENLMTALLMIPRGSRGPLRPNTF